MNGSFEADVIGKIVESADKILIEIEAPKHAIYLNEGVSANKIPFTPKGWPTASTGKKKSLYIEGLMLYAKYRFHLNDVKEQKSAAFAIARAHKREGMPTTGSYAHSKNGKRKYFVDEALITFENSEIGEKEIFDYLEGQVINIIKETNQR